MDDQIDVFRQLREGSDSVRLSANPAIAEHQRKIAEHKAWLKTIRHEYPNPLRFFKVAVYIRFFNQTQYTDEEYTLMHSTICRTMESSYSFLLASRSAMVFCMVSRRSASFSSSCSL